MSSAFMILFLYKQIKFLKKIFQFFTYFVQIRVGICLPYHHYHVNTWNDPVVHNPQVLPDQPAHPVTFNAFSDFLAGGYPEPYGTFPILDVIYHQRLRRGILSLAVYPSEIAVFLQYRQFTHNPVQISPESIVRQIDFNVTNSTIICLYIFLTYIIARQYDSIKEKTTFMVFMQLVSFCLSVFFS